MPFRPLTVPVSCVIKPSPLRKKDCPVLEVRESPKENSLVLIGVGAVRRLGSPRGAFEVPGGDLRRLFPRQAEGKGHHKRTNFDRECHIPRACRSKAPLWPVARYPAAPEALQSSAEPFRALQSSVHTPATEPCRVPRKSFSSTGKGKRDSQAHAMLP